MLKTKLKRKKKQFSGGPSRGLKWENKTYKLKTSITFQYYIFLVDSQLPLQYQQEYITQASDELLDVHFVRLFACTIYGLQYVSLFCTQLYIFKVVFRCKNKLQLRRNWWFNILCSSEIIALVLSLKANVQANCQ